MNITNILYYFSIIIGLIIMIFIKEYIFIGSGILVISTTLYTFYVASETPPIVGKEP